MPAFKDLAGQRFGRLVAQYPIREKGKRMSWMCKCDCGQEKMAIGGCLTTGGTQSCGCLRVDVAKESIQKVDRVKRGYENARFMIGKIFSEWTVVAFDRIEKEKVFYRCLCSCGNSGSIMGSSLTTGNSKSCGCWNKKRQKGYVETLKGESKKRHEKDIKYLNDVYGGVKTGYRREDGMHYCGMRKNLSVWSTPEVYEREMIKRKLRSCVYGIYRGKRFKKNTASETLLGESFEFCRQHLSNLLQDGMSWENHGKWHIDHIIPMAYAKTQEEAEILCHYSNLQPMWGTENLSKNDTLPENVEEKFLKLKAVVLAYRENSKKKL